MFIQIVQGHCTDEARVRQLGDQWVQELAPGASGWLGGTYGLADDGLFLGVVRFDSRESAMANSERPEQGAWWSEMAKCFDGPVEFHDCEDVVLLLGGGSDSAEFVQVIQGKVDDPAKLKGVMANTDALHEMRPDILGATLAIDADGTFTETVAFTNEAAARQAEQQEMPDDLRDMWETAVHDMSYVDLHRPWFASRS
ncbi:MAG: hypothetical protein QOK15_3723 [Nocardioidaceae bacterium]|jgi:hypothetical protein|nr:hypothetical protein [Nocardioidaceae bacterium]